MTLEELSKYHTLKKELSCLDEQIKELSKMSISSSDTTTISSKAGNNSIVERINLKKEKLESRLENKREELIEEQKKIEDFIETIEDASIRIIIKKRFILCKKWKDIAKELEMDRTTPYYQLKKFLEGDSNEWRKSCNISRIWYRT